MGGVEVALRPEFCWLPRGPCFWGRGGAAAGGCLLPDLNEEEAAAASGAEARGAGADTASRADSLPSITEMMSLIALDAMEGSLNTSRRMSVSYMPASRMSRTTESV